MLPYILLFLISVLFSFATVKKQNNQYVVVMGKNDNIKRNNCAIIAFFVLLLLIMALRDESVGRDLVGYRISFKDIISRKNTDIIKEDEDTLYVFLNWIVGKFTTNFQWFIAISSALTLIPIFYVYNQNKNYSVLKILLFLNMTTFPMVFSGIRQSIAMGIGMIAYLFVKSKNIIPFVISVVIAIGFHHSAFILFFMYPLYHFAFKRKHLLVIIPAVLTIFVFNKQVFAFLTDIMGTFSEEYSNVEMTETGAIGSLILFIIFAVFCYIIPDEKSMSKELFGLRNFMVFVVILQCFAPLHTLAMRLNYYYILFVPILVPQIMTLSRVSYRQVSLWGGRIMSVFFTYLYLSTVVTSYYSGISTLDIIPYTFFWQ